MCIYTYTVVLDTDPSRYATERPLASCLMFLIRLIVACSVLSVLRHESDLSGEVGKDTRWRLVSVCNSE